MSSAFDRERMYRYRLDRANQVIRNKQLDAILFTSYDNIRYISDCRIYFTTITLQNSYAAILRPGEPPLIQGPAIDAKHEDHIARVEGWAGYPLVPTNAMRSKWCSMVSSMMKNQGIISGRVGIDDMSFMTYEELKKNMPRIEFIQVYDEMLVARAIKSLDEIYLLRKAAYAVDAGARAGLDCIKAGVKETDIVARMVSAMAECGSEAEPWAASLTSGRRTLKSIFATDKTVEAGELVVFDIGAIFEGYVGDIARTGAVGSPPAEARRLYTAVYDALDAGIETVRPGIKSSEVNRIVRDTLTQAGYDVSFFCAVSTGHGVGLNAPEIPWLCVPGEGIPDYILEPGMVIAIEPRAASPGLTSAACEDMILVTDAGHEVLTKCPKQEKLLVR